MRSINRAQTKNKKGEEGKVVVVAVETAALNLYFCCFVFHVHLIVVVSSHPELLWPSVLLTAAWVGERGGADSGMTNLRAPPHVVGAPSG